MDTLASLQSRSKAGMRTSKSTTAPEPWQWAAIRRGAAAVILGLSGVREIPCGWELPRWPLALQRYTIALELHWQREIPRRIPEAVLIKAAVSSPLALELAELCAARVPTEQHVTGVAEALRTLETTLRREGRLPGVANLAAAIIATITTMQAGTPDPAPM